MASDPEVDDPPAPGVLDTLLMPLRLPGRVVSDIAKLVEGVLALQRTSEGLREDLNERMLAVEHELRAIQPSLEQMAGDVAKIDDLLPNPHDGPLTRLKDTLTSGG